MKKFTSFMLMLLCAVTTWAQVVEGQMYRLKEVSVSNAYLTIQGYNGAGETGAKGTVPFLEKSVANNDQIWFFENTGTEGQYYLKSKSEYYIVHGGWNVNAFNTENATKGIVELVDNGDETYKLKNINAGKWYKSEIPNGGGEYEYPYCDANEGAACNWVLELVDESEFSALVTVTYDFKDNNGVTRFTQNADVIDGAEYPAINVAFPFGVTATKPAGNVNKEDAVEGVVTVDVPLTVGTLPFVAAETADGITNWYYMQMHWNNKKYVAANGTAIEWKETAVPEDNKDAYTWGFVGNIWDGFKVVNYAAYDASEEAYTLTFANGATSLAAFDAATQFPMVHTAWGPASAESFCLAIPNTANYLNAQSSTLASWSDADAGSTITLTERLMTLDAELEAIIAEYEAIGIVAGTNIGDFTAASVEAFEAALATAKAVTEATEADIEALQAAYDALAIVLPDPAKVYALNSYKDYLFQEITGSTDLNTTATEIDTRALWQVVEAEGGFMIKNIHTGMFIGANAKMSEEAVVFEITKTNVEGGATKTAEAGQVYIKFPGSTNCVHSTANTAISWAGGGAGNQYAFEEVSEFSHTLTVSEAGYATLMLGFNATIPAGAECYYAAEAIDADGILNLTQVEGNVLPANTAVIVKAAANEYEFAYTTEAGNAPAANLLSGTLYTKVVTPAGTAYVLANGVNGVGLYKAELTDFIDNTGTGQTVGVANSFQNNANKVYLDAAASTAASYSFNFDWAGTTAVEGVVAEGAQNGKIYDITGREVKAITVPGLYIINGVKIVK